MNPKTKGTASLPVNHRSYDKIVHEWTVARNASFVSQLAKDFAQKVPSNGRILDAGCGSGYLSRYLAAYGFQVTGVDASERMIDMARLSNAAGTDFITADFFDFVPPQKFDGVIAWDSFFHFPKSKQGDIYRKAASLLHRKGYLLFTHGDADDEHVDQMMGESFYYSALAKEQVFGLLDKAGFALEYAYTDYREQNTHRSLVVLAKKVR